MDHIWKTIGILGIDILELCSSHPVPYHKDALEAEVPGALLGLAVLLVSIVCLVACVCCRENQRKGFKEFRDSTHSLHHTGLSFTNPGLSPGSELAIFPPPGVTSTPSVTFEPLPTILSPVTVHTTRKPSAYRNLAVDSLSDADWFTKADLDFPRQQLQYLRECGRGWFGRVVEGEARGLADTRYKVMVRMLREDATPAEQKFFLNEAKPYRDLTHPNVLKMVGRCLETNPYLVLLEACSAGDLKSFLCGNLTSSSVLCEQGVCLRIMCQVATGLQHMISHGFVHTDLAARNCQVTSDLTVKVGDYGTSIDTYKDDYYIAGDVAVPVRWCAPETLHCTDTTIETKQVTAEANVWSLGVLLWEVCQFGQMPYTELTDDQVIVQVLGVEGLRLSPPTLHFLHAGALYSLMTLCWQPSSNRASLDHVLSMLNHLHSSHSEEDFQRRWDALRPNATTPEINLETMTARSDFDSGVDLEIKSTDREVLDLVKKSSSDVNLSPSTASPQLSVASSSGGEFFSQTSLSVLKKQLSPSMTNLRGSVEDVTKPAEEENTQNVTNETEEFDSWLKGVETTNEEDVKFVKKISEAIKDLDDALALEKTSSSSDNSSRQESPLKDTNTQDENPVLDFRLGPFNGARKLISLQPDSLQNDSLRRDSSGTDTEDETWRGRIERGEFSEKVKEKSKSVTDLMILTHIESEGSESDSLPSLTRQYSVDKNKRKTSGAVMSTIGFGSEGNIRGAVLGEEFQDALKQLQAEWRLRDMESRENSLQFIKNEAQSSQHQDKLDFLSNDASEKHTPKHECCTTHLHANKNTVGKVPCSSQTSDSGSLNYSMIGASLLFPEMDATLSYIRMPLNETKQDEVQETTVIEGSESSLKPILETAETSDSSQNTESSSEISTPTQYEVFTNLDSVQLFIDGEKEHGSSLTNCRQEIKVLPSKILTKSAENCVKDSTNEIVKSKVIFQKDENCLKNVDEHANADSVQIVPIVDDISIGSFPDSETEHFKTICDTAFNDSNSVIINPENISLASVNKSINKEYGPTQNDVTILDKEVTQISCNDLLSNSATQKEFNFSSGNLVVNSRESLVSNPEESDKNDLCNSSSTCEKASANTLDFLLLSDEKEVSTFVPEIVVTEASILDIDSDSEPELPMPNTIRSRRNIRIIMSSSDDSDDEDIRILDSVTVSDTPTFKGTDFITSTPNLKERKKSLLNDNVSEAHNTFEISSKSDPFFVPLKNENKSSSNSNNETSVILGSCEDYTLDYFKGLKTTFGKQISDESTDEFSKSEGEEDERKQSAVNWDGFLTSTIHHHYEENPVNSDIEFETSDTDIELNDKNREDNIANFSNFSDDNVDILKPRIKLSEHFNEDMRNNVMICDRMDIFNNLSGKQNYEDHDHQMQEVKNRLEDVAMLSESFCLKNQNISMDDDEDGKLLTPDDERSSDSGFRDKGSLSESVEDACDEKYNLEDIDAELEEQYAKQLESKSTDDVQENKIDLKEASEVLKKSGDLGCNENIYVVNEDSNKASNTDIDMISIIKLDVENSEESEELLCLPSEPHDEKQERLNKLDSALNSDIDLYFEPGSQTKTGWYLHPPHGTLSADSQPIASGWLPSAPEETKDTSYVSFDINEEFVTAIRNELREKLPCAQNAERTDTEEDVSPEEERTDMVIQYNTFPVPLSPIFEERESISSNQSSLLLDDTGKSIESSGKSSPILYLDATKEDENLSKFEDDIRNALDVCSSESTESDNVLVTVEDLENSRGGKAQKVVENTKDEMDDLLIVDTETNKVTLYESPRPRSQLAFVRQVVEPSDDNNSVNSETYTFYHSADDNMLSVDRNNVTYTPDSVSPLSSGSSRTGVAVSFSSSETGGNLSGFYLSPSSVRSDMFDNGPPSLPFDLGHTYEPVEEIRPNNEAEEIVKELLEAGVLKEADLKQESNMSSGILHCGIVSSKDTSEETPETDGSETSNQNEETVNSLENSVEKNESSKSSDSNDLATIMKGDFNTNILQICSILPKNNSITSCDKLDEMLESDSKQLQPVQEGQLELKISNSQDWLKSVLLPSSNSLPESCDSAKSEGVLVCLNSNGWPSTEELIPQPLPAVRCDSQVAVTTPDSPSMDLLEVAAKFYDVNSTLAISTPNNTSFDESKDNSQLSSFTSTPTLETAKCITGSTKNVDKPVLIECNNVQKDTNKKIKHIPTLSNLASEIVLKLPTGKEETNVPSEDSSPDDSERKRRLQGMTLALEPSLVSKAPMPSPEDADKGVWRPTMGQLMELTNQPEQDDMMTTSFIDADNNDYTPDWESDTSDDSEDHSSSSGEFIWREGDREEAVRVVIACDDFEPQEGVSEMSMARISEEEGEEDGDEEDNSSCGSTTEFIPSTWDSNATPTKSALRSAEKQKGEKRSVCFKRQKYHCVYEYPREPSDSEEDDESVLQRRTWQSPSTFDYSTYADWEYGEGEVDEAESDSDDNAGPRQLPESEYDFYRLSNLDFEMITQMNLDDGEFFISSSARPFQMGDSSQFFPGSISDDDFLVEFQPCAADTDDMAIPSPQQLTLDETITGKLREITMKEDSKCEKEKQKPSDLFIVAEPVSENTSSAEVSPTLGELRHTRQRLKLDLGRGGVRGEASLLDSGGEDSGVESTATGSSDRLDQVQSSEA